MQSLREIIIFWTGVQTCLTLFHFLAYFVGFPPFQYGSWKITPQVVFWIGVLNAVIALLMFWWITTL